MTNETKTEFPALTAGQLADALTRIAREAAARAASAGLAIPGSGPDDGVLSAADTARAVVDRDPRGNG